MGTGFEPGVNKLSERLFSGAYLSSVVKGIFFRVVLTKLDFPVLLPKVKKINKYKCGGGGGFHLSLQFRSAVSHASAAFLPKEQVPKSSSPSNCGLSVWQEGI